MACFLAQLATVLLSVKQTDKELWHQGDSCHCFGNTDYEGKAGVEGHL